MGAGTLRMLGSMFSAHFDVTNIHQSISNEIILVSRFLILWYLDFSISFIVNALNV